MSKKWTERLFYIFISVMAILMIAILLKSKNVEDVSFFDKNNVQSVISGWYLYDTETGNSKSVYLPGEFDVEAGETLVLKRLLDNIQDGEVLCFRTEHTSVRALIDGKEIYSFGWDENIPIGKSPGSVWNVIELSKDYRSKTITLEFNCPYNKYSGVVTDIIRGQSGDINLYILEDSLTSFILNLAILVLGLILIIAFIIGMKELKMKALLYLGIFLVVNAIWGLCESRFLQFQYGNAFALQMLNSLMFVFVPVCVVMTLDSLNFVKRHTRLVYGIVFGCSAFVIALQFLEIKDFFETMELIHVSILAACGVILYDSYVEFKHKKLDGFGYVLAAFLTLAVSIFFDMIMFYTFGARENGLCFRIGTIIFVIVLGAWAIKQALTVHKDTAQREAVMKMAYIDNLTGLYNRRSFDDELSSIETEKVKAIIVMIDLNNLKTINDQLGHQSGDMAIKAISGRLKIFMDKYDEKSFRTGGDEFCVICRHITVNEVISVCERINDELNKSKEVPGAKLSMAYGYKVYEPHSIYSVEQVVKQADEQMYVKKQKMKEQMKAEQAKADAN